MLFLNVVFIKKNVPPCNLIYQIVCGFSAFWRNEVSEGLDIRQKRGCVSLLCKYARFSVDSEAAIMIS
jgi:hypothetical protein